MSQRILLVPRGSEAMRDRFHFSPGVRVGDVVYVSGQGGWDPSFQISPEIGAQARQAFRNIGEVLAEAGASLDDVVELTSYHLDMDQIGAVVEALREAFPRHEPAWTAVGVTRLAMPTMQIEIKATAILGSGGR